MPHWNEHPQLAWSAPLLSVLMALQACTPAPTTATPTAAIATQQPPAPPAPSGVSPAPSASPVPGSSPSPIASSSPGSASPTGPAGSLTSISVSYSNLAGDEIPVWVAQEAGIFRQNGLDATLESIPSNQGIAGLLSGQVQAADLGGSEVMSAVAGGADLVDLGVGTTVYPLVFMAAPSITSVQDLKGKRVAVINIGTTADIATRLSLRQEGLDPETDVTIIPTGTLANRAAAMANGAVDGALIQPPDTLQLESLGFHTLFDVAQLGITATVTSIAMQRSYVGEHPQVAQAYIDSYIEAIARARADKPFTVQVLQKYLGSDDEHAMEVTYDYYMGEAIARIPSDDPALFDGDKAELTLQNPAVAALDISAMLDPSFLQSAAARGIGQ